MWNVLEIIFGIYIVGFLLTPILIGIFERYEFGLWHPKKNGEVDNEFLMIFSLLWFILLPIAVAQSIIEDPIKTITNKVGSYLVVLKNIFK